MSRPYRILCLDGGGVRGALTTVILTRICQHHPNFLKDIDFICGTSAGGILSLMLASGYSAAECHEMYTFAAPHIFAHNPWRVINPTRARYSDKAKQELMQHYFGQRTMADLEMTCAAVAFRLDGRKSMTHSFFHREGWRPAVFSNMPLAEGLVAPDNDLLVWDAAMRTSAAPTYFPVYHGYTDGGVVANNPSILAVSKAMAHYPHVNTRNVAVLSIGAGSFPRHMNIFQQIHEERDAPLVVDGQIGGDFHGTNNKLHNTLAHNQQGLLAHADWGVKQWLPFLLDLLIDGESVTTEMVMHYLLAGNKMYHRLDPRLPKNFALDDVTLLQEIQDFAWTVDLTSTLDFVDNFFTYEEELDSSMAHNSLDSASHYHEAWLYEVSQQHMQQQQAETASQEAESLTSVFPPNSSPFSTSTSAPSAFTTEEEMAAAAILAEEAKVFNEAMDIEEEMPLNPEHQQQRQQNIST
jgi:predicted acylesterase/phospholipase RssA